jgi:hypothetical protein
VTQIILSASLLFIVVYAFTQKTKSPFVSAITMLCALSGLYFVWVPDHATVIAHAMGIGRGADLIVYIWIVISLAILLNLHFKVRSSLEVVTSLARMVAIAEAERYYSATRWNGDKRP